MVLLRSRVKLSSVMLPFTGLLLASCGSNILSDAAGDSETDRQSRTLADAIAYPRQADAMGFARAAMATNLGKTGTFAILEATDLPHDKGPEEPMARLVWRIHRDAANDGFNSTPALDACYSVEFNYYEASSGPSRVHCPENPTIVNPPPLPRTDIPPEYDPALEASLGKLPATPTEADVRAALATGLPTPQVDLETGLTATPPQIFVQVKGPDVGVALLARTGVQSKDCLMGRRAGSKVTVWSPSPREVAPGEKSCSAETALAWPS